MCRKLVALFCVVFSSASYSADKADYVQFFDEFQRLSSEFDGSVNTMYADDAKIMGARKKPDGTDESMTIDGSRWKAIIVASMERAKQHDDRSEYSDISIDVGVDQAKITATRYSAIDCFTDSRFYMVVKSDAADKLQIVEQFMETAPKSKCEGAEPELPEFLQNTVKMVNKQLPAAIDAETQLIKTSAEGTELTYHYVLINYTSQTLSTEEATKRLQPLIIQQSCGSPNLRPVLDQGGSIKYIYRGSDAAVIATFGIDRSAC